MDAAPSTPPPGEALVEIPVEITIEAVVTRADGTVEDLGVISRHEQTLSRETLDRIRAEQGIEAQANP